MEHRYLAMLLPLGLAAGALIGVLIWIFTHNLFGISLGAGFGMLAGIVIGAAIDGRNNKRQ